MRPRLKSVGLALTQFSVGITTLLVSLVSLPPIPPLTEVAQAQTIQERQAQAQRLLKRDEELLEREFTSVLQFYQQALNFYQEIKDPQGEIEAWEGLAEMYLAQKQYPKAIEYFQKQLNLAREIQDDKREYEALNSLYEAYMKAADYAKAIETAERVLLAPESEPARDLWLFYRAYMKAANYAKAIETAERMVSLASESDIVDALGLVYEAYMEAANYAKAIETAERMVSLASKSGTALWTALWSLSQAYMEVANYAKAIETAERMVSLASESDITKELEFLARAYAASGNQAKADETRQRIYSNRQRVYSEKLKQSQKRLTLARKKGDRISEINALDNLARFHLKYEEFAQAVDYYEQGLKIARASHEQKFEISFLIFLGKVYHQQGDSTKATGYFNQAFQLVQEPNIQQLQSRFLRDLGDLVDIYFPKVEIKLILAKDAVLGEASRLLWRCEVWRKKSQFASALPTCKQALKIYQVIKDTQGQIEALNELERVYSVQGKYPEVAEYAQKRLELVRAIQDYKSENSVLLSLYKAYRETANYAKAIEIAEQRLELAQKQDKDISSALSDLELAYAELGDQTTVDEFRQKIYLERLKVYQQNLARAQARNDWIGERLILRYLGRLHLQHKEFAKAIESYEEAYEIALKKQRPWLKRGFLQDIGRVYLEQGNSAKATDYFQQALEIARRDYDPLGEAGVLEDLGDIYLPDCDCDDYVERQFADYPKGIEYYQQAIVLIQKYSQETQDNYLERYSLFKKLGDGYKASGNYAKALENYTKALENYTKALTFSEQEDDDEDDPEEQEDDDEDDPEEKANLLERLAKTYMALGDYTKAIELFQQQLAIGRRWDYSLQKSAFRNLGLAYQRAGNPVKTLEVYQMELALSQERNDRNNQVSVLNSVASLFVEQNKPELAIVFYKQSVNVIETTRQELRQLPKRIQEAYTRKVEGTYRRLADLLLSQGRIVEAEKVLELLRIQEIRNYTRNADVGGQTSGVSTNPVETQVLQTHGTLIAFGQKMADCEQSKCNQLSQLLDQREALSEEFNRAVKALEQTVRDNRRDDRIFTDPTQLFGNPDKIVSAQPGTILLQTLVLPDKLWVLWASQGGVTKSIPVAVEQKQLSETVLKFRQLLQNPNSDIQELQATGKQLYDWLIPKELQAEFAAHSIQHLVFSLDHVTRYIPMAALFDGKQYLTQRYTLSTIISTNTQMGNSQLLGVQNTSVLALGLSEAKAGFNPLPNVPVELDAIVRQSESDSQGIYPGSEYLNSAFDWRTLRDNLSAHNILHIATHGKFEPGNADASFLLMGDGEKLPIPKIETLKNLRNLQLVALSACETALGGTGQDGTEIAGISYYFLNNGAKAVMASLWAVNDGSTSLLMQQFYKKLATSQQPITKAEALRQAQLSLLNKQVTGTDAPQRADGDVAVEPKPGAQLPRSRASDFSHPYYWAPFILIGNSL